MSKLSDLTARYEKLLEETHVVKNEIKTVLGDAPQAFLSPFNTTITSSAMTVGPKWVTTTVAHKRINRIDALLNRIEKEFKHRPFKAADLGGGQRERFKNSLMLARLAVKGGLRRVAFGKYVFQTTTGIKRRNGGIKKGTMLENRMPTKVLKYLNLNADREFGVVDLAKLFNRTPLQMASCAWGLASRRKIVRRGSIGKYRYHSRMRYLPSNKKAQIVGTPLDNPVGV